MSRETEELTQAEVHEQAKDMLSSLGVDDPTVGETETIPISSSGEFEVIETEIRETTRPAQKALNQFPRRGDERFVNNIYSRPLCNVLGCGALSLIPGECMTVSEEYVDPVISFQNTPRKLKNVTIHVDTNPRIVGGVEIGADNFSEPGEVITTKEYKCSQDEEEVEKVDESAIIDMQSNQSLVDEAANETIDAFETYIPGVQPEMSKSTDVEFRKEGAINVLRGIVQNWRSGRIRGQVTGTVDIQYEWKGSTKNRRFEINTTSMIPVEGDLSVDWPLI